jgi:hypothetical protein
MLAAQKWSQSPVPPRTKRAYETHVSAGSTTVLALATVADYRGDRRFSVGIDPHL